MGDTVAVGLHFTRPITEDDLPRLSNLRKQFAAIPGVKQVYDTSLVAALNQVGVTVDTQAHDNTISLNYIGTDHNNTPGEGNTNSDIVLDNASSNTVRQNVITGSANGVTISGSGSQNNTVVGNTILNNTSSGITINGAANNTIGGTASADANNILSNLNGIILSQAQGTTIVGNKFGTDTNGNYVASFANTNLGILLNDSSGSTIYGNFISGSSTDIQIQGNASQNNTVTRDAITNTATRRGYHGRRIDQHRRRQAAGRM